VVAADEVAARPAQQGHPERSERVEDVAPEAALVGERRAFVEDAAVDAAPEMLDEAAEDAAVDAATLPIEVERDPGHTGLP
jgi:hypothetical protein